MRTFLIFFFNSKVETEIIKLLDEFMLEPNSFAVIIIFNINTQARAETSFLEAPREILDYNQKVSQERKKWRRHLFEHEMIQKIDIACMKSIFKAQAICLKKRGLRFSICLTETNSGRVVITTREART